MLERVTDLPPLTADRAVRGDFMQRTLILAATLIVWSGASFAEDAPSPAPQSHLAPMLRIDWSRGPNLPQGFQDSDGGFIGTTLVTAGGFCSGGLEVDNRLKPGKYPRGFLRKAWGLDISAAHPQWERLPDFPGEARQGLFSVVLDQSLFLWGGFSYSEPCCYADGWQLQRIEDKWQWRALPDLPYRLTSAGMCCIGRRIFVMGGADYDGVRGFHTEADRSGKHLRLGARLLMLDTANLDAGWQSLAECPGTPRFVHAVQAVGGKVFVIGGATGSIGREGQALSTCTVVDNWRFDPDKSEWSRLRDLPVSSGNFPKSSNLVCRDRYIVLPGGHQYDQVANPDGTRRAKYGSASQHNPASGLHNDVFVYDTQTDLFGTADKLPIDNNLPMATIKDDRIYLLGGETGGGEIEGEHYGHHPDLLLIGQIRESGREQPTAR